VFARRQRYVDKLYWQSF